MEIGKLGYCNRETLAQLVDDSQLDGIVCALDQIMDGGFWNTASGRKLVLRHIKLIQQFLEPQAYCLVQLQRGHRPFLFSSIIENLAVKLVHVAEPMLAFL